MKTLHNMYISIYFKVCIVHNELYLVSLYVRNYKTLQLNRCKVSQDNKELNKIALIIFIFNCFK